MSQERLQLFTMARLARLAKAAGVERIHYDVASGSWTVVRDRVGVRVTGDGLETLLRDMAQSAPARAADPLRDGPPIGALPREEVAR